MKVLVTGGRGFLGKAVMEELKQHGLEGTALGRADGDLTVGTTALRVLQQHRPESVIHLAASVGGIGANRASPGTFWQENTLMGVNVLDACLATAVKRVVVVGTTCSYPQSPKTFPFIEEELFDGFPERTNAPYGIAKRSLIVGALAYRKQFGLDAVVVVPTNLYGPDDNFDDKTSHVIPAIMKKMLAATIKHDRTLELWGTGKPTRDFLHVADAAHGVVLALEKAPSGEILNLGSGTEISIKALAEELGAVVGFRGALKFNPTYPDGQMRRALDITKAQELLGWSPVVKLRDGLEKLYTWWRSRG